LTFKKACLVFVVNRSDCYAAKANGVACPEFAKLVDTALKSKNVIMTAFRTKWVFDSDKSEATAYFDGALDVIV